MLDSKLYVHCHVDYVHSQAVIELGPVRCVTYNFSSLGALIILYDDLITSKLALVV
jgi:hypothetical protein